MADISGVNYKAYGISGKNQFGSDTKVKNSNKTDLTDGLSKKELEAVDENKDGIITEAEYKAAAKKNGMTDTAAKNAWDAMTAFTKASQKKNADGTSTVTQKQGNQTITTVFNDKGVPVSTTVKDTKTGVTTTTNLNSKGKTTSTVKTAKNGTETTTNFDVKTGKKTSVQVKATNGKVTLTNFASDGKTKYKQTVISADGKTTTVTNFHHNSIMSSKTVTTQDTDKQTTTKKYNANNKLTSYSVTTQDNDTQATTKSYNANNKLTSTTVTKTAVTGTKTAVTTNTKGETTKKTVTRLDGSKTVTDYSKNKTTTQNYNSKGILTSKNIKTVKGDTTTVETYTGNKKTGKTVTKKTKDGSDVKKYNEKGTFIEEVVTTKKDGVTTVETKNANGHVTAKTVTEKKDGTTTTKKYGDSNNLVSTTTSETKTLKDGSKVKTKVVSKPDKPDVITTTNIGKNGNTTSTVVQEGLITTKTISATGLKIKTDGDKNVINTAKDGTVSKVNEGGQLTGVTTKIGGVKYSANIEYSGTNVKSVKIGDTTYTNVSVNGGTTVIKDNNGKTVMQIHSNSNGTSKLDFYKDGKRQGTLALNSDKQPGSVYKANPETGKNESRTYCNTQLKRTYEYDASGKIKSSVDTNKSGEKVAQQNYDKYGNWANRTEYNAKGEVTKYKEYEYLQISSTCGHVDTITNETNIKTYTDDSKSVLVSEKSNGYDKYGNIMSSTTTSSSGKTNVEYFYNENPPSLKLNSIHYTQTLTTKTDKDGNTTYYLSTYKDGKVVDTKKSKTKPEILPTGDTTTPPAAGTTTPPASGTTTPPAAGTTTPPAAGTTTPPATGTTTPPATGTTTPPAAGTTTPPATGTTTPPATGEPASSTLNPLEDPTSEYFFYQNNIEFQDALNSISDKYTIDDINKAVEDILSLITSKACHTTISADILKDIQTRVFNKLYDLTYYTFNPYRIDADTAVSTWNSIDGYLDTYATQNNIEYEKQNHDFIYT